MNSKATFIEDSDEFQSISRTSSFYTDLVSDILPNPIEVAAMRGPGSIPDEALLIATPEKRRRFQSLRQVRSSWRKIFARSSAS
jgi:hypothetical protein